jgi:hypothetical protein
VGDCLRDTLFPPRLAVLNYSIFKDLATGASFEDGLNISLPLLYSRGSEKTFVCAFGRNERRGGRGVGFLIRRILPPVNRMVSTSWWIAGWVLTGRPVCLASFRYAFAFPSSGAIHYVFRLWTALSKSI